MRRKPDWMPSALLPDSKGYKSPLRSAGRSRLGPGDSPSAPPVRQDQSRSIAVGLLDGHEPDGLPLRLQVKR